MQIGISFDSTSRGADQRVWNIGRILPTLDVNVHREIFGRLRASNNTVASLLRGAIFGEAYNMCFNVPLWAVVSHHEAVEGYGVFHMHGNEYIHSFLMTTKATCSSFGWLKKYLMCKYDVLSAAEADEILDEVDSCVVKPRLRFVSGSGTQTASSYYGLQQWDG